MFESWFPQDMTTLRKLLWFRTAWEKSGKPPEPSDPLITLTGKIISFFSKAAKPFKSTSITIEPVQSGTGDPSPTNVRPISGWTGATVNRTGKNLFDKTVFEDSKTSNGITFTKNEDGSITANGTAVGGNATYVLYNTSSVLNLLSFLQGQTVVLSGCPSGGSTSTYYINGYRFINSGTGSAADVGSGKDFVFSIGEGYPNCAIVIREGVTANNLVFKPQLELGSTASDYEPFSGTFVSLTFGQTVYGGQASDNGDGSWTVVSDRAMETYNSASDFASHNSGRWYHNGLPSGADYSKRTSAISNQATYSDSTNTYKPYFAFGSAGVYVNKLESTETIEAFGARLQANPMTICYYLAEPITFTVSGDTLSSLVGVNTVWADTNGDTTIEVYGTPIT